MTRETKPADAYWFSSRSLGAASHEEIAEIRRRAEQLTRDLASANAKPAPRIGGHLGIFRTWTEFFTSMAWLLAGLAVLGFLAFMLWALGEQWGQRNVWLPAMAFLAGMAAWAWAAD